MYDEGLCRFIDAYKDGTEVDCDLNVLANKYKEEPSSSLFSSIYYKIYGMVQSMGWTFQRIVPPDEICSLSFISLQKSLDSWDSQKHQKIKFLTYFTTILRNDLITKSRSKHYRDFSNNNCSLDTMVEDGFDIEVLKDTSLINIPINIKTNNNNVVRLIEYINKYNVYYPREIKELLDIDNKEFFKCRNILKKMIKKDPHFSNILCRMKQRNKGETYGKGNNRTSTEIEF